MKKVLMILLLLAAFSMPASAAELEEAPVPEYGSELLPSERGTFSQDLWYVLRSALSQIMPDLRDSVSLCLRLFAALLLFSVAGSFTGLAQGSVRLCGIVLLSLMLLGSTNSFVQLGQQTVRQISDYGKLLLPVVTAALAAQGGTTSSAALYTGTVVFDGLLSTLISKILVPLVYAYIALSVVHAATKEDPLKRLRDFTKWFTTWGLKILLYIFVGYMSITGVVSGNADQIALKATKLTISGAVPVVGGILSDASEAVVVSVGTMKSAAGIYGILAVIAICIGPFLRIGVQYLLLKFSAFLAGTVCESIYQEVIDCFSNAMGFLLAMTGAISLLQLISVVCFMRGVSL